MSLGAARCPSRTSWCASLRTDPERRSLSSGAKVPVIPSEARDLHFSALRQIPAAPGVGGAPDDTDTALKPLKKSGNISQNDVAALCCFLDVLSVATCRSLVISLALDSSG